MLPVFSRKLLENQCIMTLPRYLLFQQQQWRERFWTRNLYRWQSAVKVGSEIAGFFYFWNKWKQCFSRNGTNIFWEECSSFLKYTNSPLIHERWEIHINVNITFIIRDYNKASKVLRSFLQYQQLLISLGLAILETFPTLMALFFCGNERFQCQSLMLPINQLGG